MCQNGKMAISDFLNQKYCMQFFNVSVGIRDCMTRFSQKIGNWANQLDISNTEDDFEE